MILVGGSDANANSSADSKSHGGADGTADSSADARPDVGADSRADCKPNGGAHAFFVREVRGAFRGWTAGRGMR